MIDKKIALIGFGEVGQCFAEDLLKNDLRHITAWDLLFYDSQSAPSKAAKKLNITMAESAEHAVMHADIIISAVTAEQTLNAARACLMGLQGQQYFLDINSASPNEKTGVAELLNAKGCKYIEASIMSPIATKRLLSPILLGGPYAAEFASVALGLGFEGAKFCAYDYGTASATKMCRSIIVKGMESLLSEALLSARHYGVEKNVINSLKDLFPGPDWPTLAPYMISRSIEHGQRRAEEMREVAKTVEEAGVEPLMSEACSKRQEWASVQTCKPSSTDLNAMLDGMLKNNSSKENQ